MKPTLKQTIRKVLKENYTENYMFFSNLKQMRRQINMILEMDPNAIEEILQNGHDWADDHVSESKTNLDQVFDFFKNEMEKNSEYVDFEEVYEGKKKDTQLCERGINAAKAKYEVYPSAYANGYAVQVCKGDMPDLSGEKKCSAPYCN